MKMFDVVCIYSIVLRHENVFDFDLFSRNLRPAGSKERKVFRTFFSIHGSVLQDPESWR